MNPFIDPRGGDVEDDASSTKRRSLLSLAGSLLAEISFPKLILSWIMLFVVPALLLGIAPLVASAWVSLVSHKITSPLLGVWPALLLVAVLAIGFFGVRSLFRMAESSFWSLNSLAVEPIYVACREGLRQLVEKLVQSRLDESQLAGAARRYRRGGGRRHLCRCVGSADGLLAKLALAGKCCRSCFASRSGFRRLGQQYRARRRLSRRRLHLSGPSLMRPCLDFGISVNFLQVRARTGRGGSPTCRIFML